MINMMDIMSAFFTHVVIHNGIVVLMYYGMTEMLLCNKEQFIQYELNSLVDISWKNQTSIDLSTISYIT